MQQAGCLHEQLERKNPDSSGPRVRVRRPLVVQLLIWHSHELKRQCFADCERESCRLFPSFAHNFVWLSLLRRSKTDPLVSHAGITKGSRPIKSSIPLQTSSWNLFLPAVSPTFEPPLLALAWVRSVVISSCSCKFPNDSHLF